MYTDLWLTYIHIYIYIYIHIYIYTLICDSYIYVCLPYGTVLAVLETRHARSTHPYVT